MELAELERLIHDHARTRDRVAIGSWLTHETLCRYREWVPVPLAGESRLVDIGCYQPSVGYYFKLGWKEVAGLFIEEGECCGTDTYRTDQGMARLMAVNVETEPVPLEDGWADAVLMMEIFEHFGIDPMHALWEANRILKPGGRLLLSTPNAASFNNVHRILLGHAPFGAQEFNGFSTNRHNRIYDAQELRIFLSCAGFHVENLASRSYRASVLSWRELGLHILLSAIDKSEELVSGRKRERGEWLFVQATKQSTPRERYPSDFYFDLAIWPSWITGLRQNGGSGKSRPA